MSSLKSMARWIATILSGAVSGGVVWAQEPASQPIAALISELSGEAGIRSSPSASRGQAQRFDALPLGATLELGSRSHGVLVLAGGRRFALGPNARATIAANQLTSTSGPVKELVSLPTLPRIVALDESRPTGPPGAVRLRGPIVSGLRPSHAVILTEPLVLRFDPVDGASRYAIEIENEAGRRIFAGESTTPELEVPVALIEPGASYYWTVQTPDRSGGEARGTAQFKTLSLEDAQHREALRRSLASDDGAVALALMAEIDRRLGLYPQALDGFRSAQARTPDDPAIQRAIRWLETVGRPGRR
jgi:hypothetical protein